VKKRQWIAEFKFNCDDLPIEVDLSIEVDLPIEVELLIEVKVSDEAWSLNKKARPLLTNGRVGSWNSLPDALYAFSLWLFYRSRPSARICSEAL